MSLFDEVTQPNVQVQRFPCAACSADAPWESWGVRLCIPCFDAMQGELSFTAPGFGCTAAEFPRVAAEKAKDWAAARRMPRRVAG